MAQDAVRGCVCGSSTKKTDLTDRGEGTTEVKSLSTDPNSKTEIEIKSLSTDQDGKNEAEVKSQSSSRKSKEKSLLSFEKKSEGSDAEDASIKRNNDGTINLRNANIQKTVPDKLLYLGLNTQEDNLVEMFGDVKFVVMAVTNKKVDYFANHVMSEMGTKLPLGAQLVNISKAPSRYGMYKIGPILGVTHGLGNSSLNISVNETIKLMFHAETKDPIFIRMGSCVGIGLKPGTVVVSESVLNSSMKNYLELTVLGKTVKRYAKLDSDLAKQLLALGAIDDGYETITGKTMSTNDFYEEQARTDGAFCAYTSDEVSEYLNKLAASGILSMDLESLSFAAITYYGGLRAANICVAVGDKLVPDDVSISREQIQMFKERPSQLVARYIRNYYDNVEVT